MRRQRRSCTKQLKSTAPTHRVTLRISVMWGLSTFSVMHGASFSKEIYSDFVPKWPQIRPCNFAVFSAISSLEHSPVHSSWSTCTKRHSADLFSGSTLFRISTLAPTTVTGIFRCFPQLLQMTLVKVERSVFFWVITQRVEVISPRRFGTTYWSHSHGSRIQKKGSDRNLNQCADASFHALFDLFTLQNRTVTYRQVKIKKKILCSCKYCTDFKYLLIPCAALTYWSYKREGMGLLRSASADL